MNEGCINASGSATGGILLTVLLAGLLAAGCSGPLNAPGVAPAEATAQGAVVAVAETTPAPPAIADVAAPAASTPIAPTATLPSVPAVTATPPLTAAPSATATRTPAPAATALPSPSPTATVTPTRGPTPDGVVRTLRVPILMYHYVSRPPANADIYRRDLSVTPERFAEHLRYLHDTGYTPITLDDLLYALSEGRPLPQKPVILTFDDGYADTYENAFPLLRAFGFTGHFFIITDFVDQGRAGYLSWPQIEEMSAAGQRFGSHSRDHPNLSNQPVDYLVWQALGSKEAIEEHLGYHPRWITYPSGKYDRETIAVYHSAGYWGGLTTQQGATHTLDEIFELHRVRVRGTHTADDLATLLALDW